MLTLCCSGISIQEIYPQLSSELITEEEFLQTIKRDAFPNYKFEDVSIGFKDFGRTAGYLGVLAK